MHPRHVLLAVAIAAVWGFTFVVIEVGLRDFPPLLFSALRFLVAGLPVVLIWRAGPPVAWRYVLGIGFSMAVVMFSLLFIGIHVGLPPGLASLVAQMQAFFTALLSALLLGDRPRPRQLAGIALALTGIGVIAADLPAGGSLLGLVLVIGAALAWAVANILTKLAGPADALRLVIWISAVAPMPLFAASWAVEGGARITAALLGMSWLGAGAVLYQSALATIAAYGAWNWLIGRYPASLVAPFSLLVPVFGMSFSWLLLGESVSPAKLAGAALVMAGLALTVLRRP